LAEAGFGITNNVDLHFDDVFCAGFSRVLVERIHTLVTHILNGYSKI